MANGRQSQFSRRMRIKFSNGRAASVAAPGVAEAPHTCARNSMAPRLPRMGDTQASLAGKPFASGFANRSCKTAASAS